MHLTLHLTTACNMKCDYCYTPPRESDPMSFETGRAAMEMGSRMNAGSCGIVFFGGEPLLHKNLIQRLVAHGRMKEERQEGRFHFKLTTNGTLLDEEFLQYAVDNGILIAMSFDGIREAHDLHRRYADGSGTYDSIIDRLRLLLAARPYSSILMVVNPDTACYLSESVTFLLNQGCRYLIVSLNHKGGWTDRSFKVLEREYKRLGELYIKWTGEGRKFYLSPFEVKLSSHINQHCFKAERCELGKRQISVDPQGYVYPCVQFTKAGPQSGWCIGNVYEGIDEEARQRIHDASESEKEVCQGCAVRERCNNSCGCLNWQTTGSVNGISPVQCRYEQMLMPIADRVGRILYEKRDPHFLHKHYNAAYPVLSLMEDSGAGSRGSGFGSRVP